MQTPPRITFRHVDRSSAVEERVRELLARLERFHQRITGCHVVIGAPAAPYKGGPFSVNIELMVPGGVINAGSGQTARDEHADVYLALRDAFDSAKRQLQDFERVTGDARLAPR